MATFGKLRDAHFSWNSVDLSDRVIEIDAPFYNRSEEEVSTMGDEDAEFVFSRADHSFSVTFIQDYYTSEVDATLQASAAGTTAQAFEIMADKTAGVSTVNPKYTGSARILGYNPLSAAYDNAVKTTVQFRVTGAITRATA